MSISSNHWDADGSKPPSILKLNRSSFSRNQRGWVAIDHHELAQLILLTTPISFGNGNQRVGNNLLQKACSEAVALPLPRVSSDPNPEGTNATDASPKPAIHNGDGTGALSDSEVG